MGYDAWRTTPPWDKATARPRFCPQTVSTPLLIEAGEVQIDASGHYSTTTGELVSVEINGQHISPDAVSAALGVLCRPGDAGQWDDDLDEDVLADLIRIEAQDAEADWADSQRD